MECNLCEADDLEELGQVGLQPNSVTSDSKLYPLPARIYYCRKCDHLQKVFGPLELKAITAIYDSYDAHHLSGGNEQLVFPDNLPPRPRTYHALEQCTAILPKAGKLLDVGSGNGAVLKSASKLLPLWSLYAFDIGEKYRKEIEKIHNVVNFSSAALENLPSTEFDLIVLWHALEHVSKPKELLKQLRERLSNNGFLLLQVPDTRRTPFDLAVIDHCSHFTRERLLKLCQEVGLALAIDGYNWTHNCITLLLKRGDDSSSQLEIAEDLTANIYFHWLNSSVGHFQHVVGESSYAMFGTGMASIWLSNQLSQAPISFVDEDDAKTGVCINGIPIVKPEELTGGLNVVMPFTQEVGRNISTKIQKLYPSCRSCNFVLNSAVFENSYD